MRSILYESFQRRLGGMAQKLMDSEPLPRLLLAVLLVIAAIVLRALLGAHADGLSPYATFSLAVDVDALLGGLPAGALATVASAAAAYGWFGAGLDLGLGLFLAGGLLFSALAGAMRQRCQELADRRSAARPTPPARDSLDTIGGTAAALAHEVNQPLAATVTYLKVVRRLLEKAPVATPEVFQVLEKASEQTLRAGRIVTSLRDLVRRREPDKTLLGLNLLISETVDLPEIRAEIAGAALRLAPDARRDCVLADREQIRQVIVGLLRNAMEAMRAVDTRSLVISTANPDANNIRLDVIDTGCGLPESWESGAFEPFATTKAKGMGVGLSICRSIIEQHEGRIWATPNRDGGATFSFILPLQELEIDA
jgi:signal transduction histidine kinase